jgi:hypothetical protein
MANIADMAITTIAINILVPSNLPLMTEGYAHIALASVRYSTWQ